MDVVESYWNLDELEKAALFAQENKRPVQSNASAPQIHHVSHRLTAADRQRIVDAHLAGASSREVGRRYDVSKGTVINLVRQAGHRPR